MTDDPLRADALQKWFKTYLAARIGCDPNEVRLDVPVRDLGLKSIDVLAIPGDLSDCFGRTVPDMAVWDNPSANELIQSLLHEHAAGGAAEAYPHGAHELAPQRQTDDPIAVVGMACRFSGGVNNPDQLWDFLADKKSGITGYPDRRSTVADDRTPACDCDCDESETNYGGFLDTIDEFDNRFFDIPPDEALRMDPQQRLLLELSWEALEQAGIIPETLRLSRTGVFVGVSSSDYVRFLWSDGLRKTTIWDNTGGSSSIIANRVSYFLDLNGPSVVVDTACSSSLVAVHLACRSLSNGECDLAIVSGTNVLISPEPFIGFREAGVLSRTSRCRAFDKSADGMVRGEGCGVVILQRLSDARREGRPTLALLTGSAVNQDGKSNGLMAPNPRAQIAVLDSACKDARVDPSDIAYVEAHGTGTLLGDKIEAHALGKVYGRRRPTTTPLMIGSIKPNIGHLEGAAGIAGLIKAVLIIQRGLILPSGEFDEPNPDIPFTKLGLEVAKECREWPVVGGRPRCAGVSSFGFGGTNAHVIVQQAPESDVVCGAGVGVGWGGVVAWVVSGKTAAGLVGQAARLAQFVGSRAELSAVDVGYSLVTTRSVFDHRAVVVGAGRAELVAGLGDLVAGRAGAGVVCGRVLAGGSTVFVFPGQGAQWLGMGSQLYAAFPVFAEAFDVVVGELDLHLRCGLRAVLWGDDERLLDSTEFAQPALFAVEVALYRLLESWGMRPGLVMGHSVGELTAAYVAGALCLEDAALLVVARGRLMQGLPEGGAMCAVQATEDEVGPMLGEQVSIAAVNAPGAVVISGVREAVRAIADRWGARGRRVRELAVSHAFHSALMEPMIAEFKAVAAQVCVGRPSIPVVSNVTGQVVGDDFASAQYWVEHIRSAVRFADGVRWAHAAGAQRFVEVGPGGGLTSLVEQSLVDAEIVSVPTLVKDRSESLGVTVAAARAFVSGVGVDWAAVFSGSGAMRVPLPTYAFQHERFWLGPPAALAGGGGAGEVVSAVVGDCGVEADGAGLAARLRGLSGEQQYAVVLELVCEHAAAVLGRDGADEVNVEQAFSDSGFNSLSEVELRNRLKIATGAALPATIVFDYPTPTALARYLITHADGNPNPTTAAAERASVHIGEPIAVVGMGCRYPGGVASAGDLWRLVASGRDVISEFPTDRGWDVEGLFDPDPDAVGKSYTRYGGFMDDVADFDAAFFGISPGEAIVMDPQQRLLLETSWEALENAGIDPQTLRGTATGVYVGIYGDGYGMGTAQAQWYADTGHITSVASGRIAYCLGLAGPALSVDTACSSSLVALHLAANSLRAGECDLALAGGSTVLATPSIFLGFSRQRGLSTDGRCKSFAEAADGTGFSEGAGMLVLQRLSDARRAGRPVLALLAGSAVNQDGASNGLTAPSGLAQQRVIAAALADAGITGADVDAVEAHGTGTRLGDPIEAQALLATYGKDRAPDAPLWLGSIKSNIGHSQAAAGVAGVIKVIEAMRHQVLPATLHVDQPSSHVDWSSGAVQLLTEAREWPVVGGRPRCAGVSSFGVSGTNAHVIVQQAPESDVVCGAGVGVGWGGVVAWVVSGKTAAGLVGQAARLAQFVGSRAELSAVDVGYSLVTTRSVFDHRAVVVGAGRAELVAGLGDLVAGRAGAGVVCGRVLAGGSTVFVFPGQGAQWLGMGSQLYAAFPVFAEAFDVVVGELDLHLRCGLRAVLWGDDERLLDSTEFAQPALFAVEVALYRLLESWGMRPGLVMGHSVGELTAAYVAGALCLEDAALLVVARGRLMQGLPEGGAMCAVQATEDEVGPMLGEQVSIAAVNAPGAVVISGVREAVRAIADRWGARGRRVRELAVSHAFHSALMEPMIAEFKAVAAQVCVGRPSIPVVSNVTGQVVGDDFASAQYWVEHIRSAVRFADGVRWAHAAGAQRFVEVGPGGGLTSLVEQSLVDAEIVSVPTLVKDRSESLGVTVAAARAFVSGVGVDWAAVFSGSGAMRVPLPTYAFQHERFWLGPPAALAGGGGAGEVVSAVVGDCGVEADGAGLAARLRGLSGEQQYAVVLELVCEHAAAVLGRDGADEVNVEQAFSDSGFNSLSEVELRNRLKIATGAALPATIVFDYPTPTALARYLITHADGNPNPTTAECPEGEVDSLAQLFLQAHDSGREQDGWKMVALASNMRERMTVPVRRHDQYSARLLTPGVSDVALLCIPTLTVLSDVQEYREMAKAMAGRHSVYSLPLPGFCPDDALPQDQEMIMESICGTILDMVGGGERFVLAGYSSGGLLAYALGCYLAKRHQRNPLGVALIDTYLPCQIAHSRADGEFEMTEAGSSLSRKVIETARALNRLNATRLTAADAYASIFHSWQPGASIAPLLNIVAKDETLCGDDVRSERLNRWRAAGEKVAYSVAEVPGDHFEMITTSSGSTATALHDWISDRAG